MIDLMNSGVEFVRQLSGAEWWRIINGLMAAHAIILMLIFLKHRGFRNLEDHLRLFAMAVLGFLGSLMIGSYENIQQSNPVGFRTALASAAVLWTLTGLFVLRDKEKSREDRT